MSNAGGLVYLVAQTAAGKDGGGFWDASFPDWLAGVGTVATAAVSVFLLWRERGDRERQRAREARAADTERRAQASLVSLGLPALAGGVGQTDAFWKVRFKAKVTNGSTQTISDIFVTCLLFNPDGTEAVRHTRRVHRLAPGDSVEVVTPETEMPWIPSASDYKSQSEAEFTDAAGVRWRRDAEHRLSEISPLDLSEWPE